MTITVGILLLNAVKCARAFIGYVKDNHTLYCLNLVKVSYHPPDCTFPCLVHFQVFFFSISKATGLEQVESSKMQHVHFLNKGVKGQSDADILKLLYFNAHYIDFALAVWFPIKMV